MNTGEAGPSAFVPVISAAQLASADADALPSGRWW